MISMWYIPAKRLFLNIKNRDTYMCKVLGT